ncbi:flagellar motor protein MotB, partial [Sphaerisporangium cinnabarinum]
MAASSGERTDPSRDARARRAPHAVPPGARRPHARRRARPGARPRARARPRPGGARDPARAAHARRPPGA